MDYWTIMDSLNESFSTVRYVFQEFKNHGQGSYAAKDVPRSIMSEI